MTYKLELFLVIQKKKRLINIKSFKNYIFYDLLIFDSLFFTLNNSVGTKSKLNGTQDTKLRIQLKFN